jgi:hypothetical protein
VPVLFTPPLLPPALLDGIGAGLLLELEKLLEALSQLLLFTAPATVVAVENTLFTRFPKLLPVFPVSYTPVFGLR